MRPKLLALLLAGALLAALCGAASASAAGTWWSVGASVAPTNLPPAGEGQINASAADLGSEPTKASETHPLKLIDTVPAGLEVISGSVKGYARNPKGPFGGSVSGRNSSTELTCATVGQVVTCELKHPLNPYEGFEAVIPVKVKASDGTDLTNELAVEGGEGGVPSASHEDTLHVRNAATPFGVEKYELTPENEDGTLDTQAGSHPFQMSTTLNFNGVLELKHTPPAREEEAAPELPRNLHFVLPPGLLGNVTVVPQCSLVDFDTIRSGDSNLCPANTAIGAARVTINEPQVFGGVLTETVPVFNLVPSAGEPARFGLEDEKVPVVFNTKVLSGSNYAVEVSVDNSTQFAALLKSQVTFWGVPAAAIHDQSRGWECIGGGHFVEGFNRPCEPLGDPSPQPFLTLPTTCSGTPATTATGNSWVGSTFATEYKFPAAFGGCSLLGFSPALSVEPDTHAASSPTGLTVKIKVPQASTLSASGLAEADVKDTTVVLPEGVQASPGAADGLLKCTTGQVGFDPFGEGLGEALQLQNDHFSSEKASCPNAAKIGTVAIKTPLLENELTGGVYLAAQDTEPFQSPLVLYILAEDPVSGVRVKLAGEVQINQSTGQLTSVFHNTPPLPFEELNLKLFGGPRASQSTPSECGNYGTQASFNPSTELALAAASASFAITVGAEGGGCPSNPLPFAPALKAGSTDTQAGAFTHFTLTINHADSDQALNGIAVHLPPGVAAELANVTPCAEPASQSQGWECGPESLLGHATTSSGLGSDPFSLTGQVYLTTGYDGAPFGLLVATRAKAGPFDLGMVYVRSRINVDPSTAAVTITTDAGPHNDSFPTRLKGVPVQLKAINVVVDREKFQFNPTNCSAMSVTGTLSGAQGASAEASSGYGVTGCESLPFAPKLTATAGGQASKANGASLNVKVESAGLGQANIAKVDLTLPVALPSRLSTIQKACVLAVFNANPAACDEGSNIGYAIIHTPVLKNPLTGPAYLVSHGGAAFPDVEFVLQGEGITLVLDGKTDIKKGITYSRFESTPDAPFTTFTTFLPTGPHSALTAYVPASKTDSLCGANLVMPTEITGQNGAVIKQTTPIVATGCKGTVAVKVTRAQKLTKALKACRKLKKKSKRVSCEKKARKQYGPIKKKAAKKK
jgi:hypothetical protein